MGRAPRVLRVGNCFSRAVKRVIRWAIAGSLGTTEARLQLLSVEPPASKGEKQSITTSRNIDDVAKMARGRNLKQLAGEVVADVCRYHRKAVAQGL